MRPWLELVGQWDPSVGDRIRGADAASIDALERAVERPLPPDYREFLARMGESSGDLVRRGDFRIGTALAFYERLRRGRGPRLAAQRRARYLFVGACVGGEGVYPDFYLDGEGEPRGRVVESETLLRPEYGLLDDGLVTAGSLAQLVVGEAFFRLRIGGLPFRRSLLALGTEVPRQARPAAFCRSQVFRAHGLVEVMPGSLGWYAFDGEAAAVSCYQPLGLGPYWTVAAGSRALAEALIAAMKDELHLVRSVAHPSDTLP